MLSLLLILNLLFLFLLIIVMKNELFKPHFPYQFRCHTLDEKENPTYNFNFSNNDNVDLLLFNEKN